MTASFLDSPVEDVRREFETNFYGPLNVTRAFVPVIERNGGGHLLNVHSVLSWVGARRLVQRVQGRAVVADQLAAARTAPARHRRHRAARRLRRHRHDRRRHAPKADPARRRRSRRWTASRPDAYEVLADDLTRQVKAALAQDVSVQYPVLAPVGAGR